MRKRSWFDAFPMNPVFSEEDFERYKNAVKANLPFYQRHLQEGAKILNLGCGLGVSWIPLSTFGFSVVGVDSDPRVVEAAKLNAKMFGGDCQVVLGDVFDIVDLFGPDSFDACDSGGLLEHFAKKQVRDLVEKQLVVAPLVIANMPVKSEATLRAYHVREGKAEGNVDRKGIYRNFWDEKTWVGDVLRGFHVRDHFVEPAPPAIGAFEELTVVLDRS